VAGQLFTHIIANHPGSAFLKGFSLLTPPCATRPASGSSPNRSAPQSPCADRPPLRPDPHQIILDAGLIHGRIALRGSNWVKRWSAGLLTGRWDMHSMIRNFSVQPAQTNEVTRMSP
jgi:hypothetical protein